MTRFLGPTFRPLTSGVIGKPLGDRIEQGICTLASYIPTIIKFELSNEGEHDDKEKSQVVSVFTEDNAIYQHLGSVEASHYSKPITSYLHYFYDKEKSRVLVVAEYT